MIERMRKLVNDDPGLISQVMRPQPVFAGGEMKGFRVYPGANRQAFSRMGLRAGDMVTAINGTPLNDKDRAQEIFGTLGSSTDARVTITRNGRQQELVLNIAQITRRSGTPRRRRRWQYPDGAGSRACPRERMIRDRTIMLRTSSSSGPKVLKAMTRNSFRVTLLAALFAFAATGIVSAQHAGNQRPAHHAQFQGRRDRPGHRSRRGGHRQDHHPRPARARAGHDAVADADDARTRSTKRSSRCSRCTSSSPWNRAASSRSCRTPTRGRCRTSTCPSRVKSGSDELITQVIAVQNVNAAQLVPVLRPLMPQAAHMAAYPNGNILILSDRASNVSRVMRIIERIDQQGDNDVDIINLQHASASRSRARGEHVLRSSRARPKAAAARRRASSPTTAPTACWSAAKSRCACASRR